MRIRHFFLAIGLTSIVIAAGLYLYFRARPKADVTGGEQSFEVTGQQLRSGTFDGGVEYNDTQGVIMLTPEP